MELSQAGDDFRFLLSVVGDFEFFIRKVIQGSSRSSHPGSEPAMIVSFTAVRGLDPLQLPSIQPPKRQI